ncbi:MAG: quinolinate synthase NadA [Desulfosudaceae bacterium]
MTITATIARRKSEKNAIILAHNYQPPEIQDLADLCGDSLELSIKAAETDADVIVFCGVHFMAETASILCPEKTVLLPAKEAGCPMADMITPESLAAKKKELGELPVVTYVNSSAAVKAVSTVCCTSANSIKIVESLDAPELLMTPDKNLAAYTAAHTSKTIHRWNGCCPIHDALRAGDVHRAKKRFPEAAVMVHPECRPEVTALADAVLSTSGMLRYAQSSPRESFLVGTENGLLYPLQKACPDKSFHPVSEKMICADMKRIQPEAVAICLADLQPEVRVPEEIRRAAQQAVQRMLEAS